jgi:hypothetical protein
VAVIPRSIALIDARGAENALTSHFFIGLLEETRPSRIRAVHSACDDRGFILALAIATGFYREGEAVEQGRLKDDLRTLI